MTTTEELEKLKGKLDTARERWGEYFDTALRNDKDGFADEAAAGYESLISTINKWSSNFFVNEDHQEYLAKVLIILRIRMNTLRKANTETLEYTDVKLLSSVFRRLFVDDPPRDFPIDLGGYQAQINAEVDKMCNVAPGDGATARGSSRDLSNDFAPPGSPLKSAVLLSGGSLLPPPNLPKGSTVLGIHIKKCGVLRPFSMRTPYISVLVVDRRGTQFVVPQDTPHCDEKTEMAKIYGSIGWSGRVAYYLQCSLDKLPADAAFFFLIKRYKEKKKDFLTKAFAIMEQDEIKEGPIALELYLRPVEFARKNLRLLTEKPLFLHLDLKITKT